MMKVKGGIPIRRIPKNPAVTIQPGQRVFHKKADGTFEPSAITLKAEIANIENPTYRWGYINNGDFVPSTITIPTMVLRPSPSSTASVIAVKVTGSNFPGSVMADTAISIVDDGAPAVTYTIEIFQNGNVVTSIASDSEGYAKLSPDATAKLYKITGDKKVECSDYYCRVISANIADNSDSEESSGVATSTYEFEVADNYYDYFVVIFYEKTSSKTIATTTINRTLDGNKGTTGNSGYTYRPRGMFTKGETYVWNDMYRDIVLSWFNNKLHTFRVKVKGTSITVSPTSSNGDANWEVANELKFVATDLLLAQNAIINILQSNGISILNSSNVVTAGMSGSGSGETGIRFFAGSDTPVSAPYRVNELGELYSTRAHIRGQIYQDWYDITKDEAFQFLYILDKPNTIFSGWDWDSNVMFVTPKSANLKMNTPNQFTMYNTTRYTAKITSFYNDGFNVFLRDGIDICEVASPTSIDLMAYCRLELMFIPDNIIIDDELKMEVYTGVWYVLNQYDFNLSSNKGTLTSKALG